MTSVRPRISEFQDYIFSWWKKNRRDLPWRHTHDPYRILVSEVMLQQTQVSRVVPKYAAFLSAFPSITTLSLSSVTDVLKLWRGMGYNRRALYLSQLAKIVVTEYSGIIPHDLVLLRKLPGLGNYTARAILVFAYRDHTYMIDTNIRKIITYHFFKNIPQKEATIEHMAEKLLPSGRSWEWHQALMDYGALELPRLLPRTRRGRPSVAFSDSDRYYRGRIIDELRTSSYKKQKFISLLIKKYGRTSEYYEILLLKLSMESLIFIDTHLTVSLPR